MEGITKYGITIIIFDNAFHIWQCLMEHSKIWECSMTSTTSITKYGSTTGVNVKTYDVN